MTEAQLCELPIPKWLGRPMYPGGWPLPKASISFGDRNIEEIYQDYLLCVVEKRQKPRKDDVRFLKYFILYYIHAPVFDSEYTQELRDKVNEKMTLDELISACMEFGMDPL